MPTPEQTKSLYRRTLRENLKIRRYSGPAATRTSADYACLGRVWGDRPAELIGSTNQYDYRAVVFVPDLVANGLTLPITNDDKLVKGTKEYSISFPDRATRAEGDELIAYELRVRG